MTEYNDCVYRPLPRAKELLPRAIVKEASGIFARDTGLSGPQIFEFFGKYSDEVDKMRYGSGAPSRWQMFENFLESLSIERQREALLELCDNYPSRSKPAQKDVAKLLDKIRGIPVPTTLAKAMQRIDVIYVTKQWEKLSDRLKDDTEGAITSARTLLETVCLHILSRLGKEVQHKGDLPSLYRTTAEALGIVPRSGDDEAIRQILGSCSGLVQGISALRNQFGDAHGRLGAGSLDHFAHLAANAAGTLSTFLIESFETVQKTSR